MDLSNSANWLLLTVQSKSVIYVSPSSYDIEYYPLEPTEIQVSSPILQIHIETSLSYPYSSGLFKNTQHWVKAGWANLFYRINGNDSKIGTKTLRLREYNFLNFPFYGEELVPFLLRLEFPYWFRDVTFQVWEFQDKSGRYLQPGIDQALASLEDKVLGETVELSSVGYRDLPDGDDTLQQSIFVGTTKYDQYEVGRFYRKDTGEKLSDPLLVVRPGSFTATFTGLEKLPSGVIVVSVKPL